VVVVVDVGEHLNDLGLFLSQTSDIHGNIKNLEISKL